jgi:4a-hydroxytetrahydrobiopterin dehydratase
MMNLSEQKCEPCQGIGEALTGEALLPLKEQLHEDWKIVEGCLLRRSFPFPDFASALQYVNAVGALAEEEGHHPDVGLVWGRVDIDLWTHKLGGLTLSDFILAAKIDQLTTR